MTAVCQFNQTGYCKYGERCRNWHNSIVCQDQSCDRNTCTKRHSKICKFYNKNGFCKFDEHCAFKHEKTDTKRVQNISEIKDKIDKLESLVKT